MHETTLQHKKDFFFVYFFPVLTSAKIYSKNLSFNKLLSENVINKD